MMDAFSHLDMTALDPVSDFKSRMAAAEITHALVVETWKGDNDQPLKVLMALKSPDFRVVPCYRPEQGLPTAGVLDHFMVAGLRVKTTDLHRFGPLADRLERSGKWVVPHAEQGIGPLARELRVLLEHHPALRIYLPHCGWPRQNRSDDKNWEGSMAYLSGLPNIVVGISAIEYFSTESFPHNDVKRFAKRLIETFGAGSVVAASDYPLFEKHLYVEYIKLAEQWIRQKDVNWAPRFESLIFG